MRIPALLLVVWLLAGTAAVGGDTSSSLSRLGSKAAGTTKSAKSTSTKKPTMLAKMTSAPKRLITNTKNMLTPKKPPKKRQGVTAIHKDEKPQPPQQSLWGRIFDPQPTPPPSTVSEWMALEQVRPYGDSKTIR
jgi:hypothetical protein